MSDVDEEEKDRAPSEQDEEEDEKEGEDEDEDEEEDDDEGEAESENEAANDDDPYDDDYVPPPRALVPVVVPPIHTVERSVPAKRKRASPVPGKEKKDGPFAAKKRPNLHQQAAKAFTEKLYSQQSEKVSFLEQLQQDLPPFIVKGHDRLPLKKIISLDENDTDDDDDDGDDDGDGNADARAIRQEERKRKRKEKKDGDRDARKNHEDEKSDGDDDEEYDEDEKSDNLFRRHPLDTRTVYTMELVEQLTDSAVIEWLPPTRLHGNPRKLYLWSLRRFGYENMRAVYDINDLSERAGRTVSKIVRLFKISCDHRFVEPAANDTPQMRQRRDHLNHSFDMLTSMVSSAFDTVVAYAKMGELLKVGPPSQTGKALKRQAYNKCSAKLFRFRLMNLETLAGLESQQKLLIKCLNALEENNYRRYKERQIWKPHYVTIRGRQVNSHAWIYHTTIAEFVEKLISKDESPENFIEATSKAQTVEWVIRRLTTMYDSQFPTLVLDRHCWAFRNGLFWGFDPNTCLPRFFVYDDRQTEDNIPSDLFASQFIDAHFNTDWLRGLPDKQVFAINADASEITSTAGLAAYRARVAPHVQIEPLDEDEAASTTPAGAEEIMSAEDRQRAFQGEKDGRFYTGHPQADRLRQIAMEWLADAYARILKSKAVKTFEEIIDYQAMGDANLMLVPDRTDLNLQPNSLHSDDGYKALLAPRNERVQVKMVVIAFAIGRMQYNLGEYGENGQFAFLIRGMAGTGKSTLGLVVSMMYPPDKVGVLMPRTETQFGMAPLFGRWIILCPELSKKMNISPEEFKSIVAGENVHFARKHIDPIEGMWRTPILLFGNVLPDWQEAEGSLARRFVMGEFTNKVKKTDCTLPLRLREELPALIAIGNIAFLLMRHQMQKRDVWSCPPWLIPNYFHRTRARLRSRLDTMLSFLYDRSWIIQQKNRYIHFKDLASDYAQWCHSTNLTKVSFTADNYEPLFQELGLRDFECKLPWNNIEVSGRFVFGIGRASGGDQPLDEAVAELILRGLTPDLAREQVRGDTYTEVNAETDTKKKSPTAKPSAPKSGPPPLGRAGKKMGKMSR